MKATVDRGQMSPKDLETTRMHFVLEQDSARTSIPWQSIRSDYSLFYCRCIQNAGHVAFY